MPMVEDALRLLAERKFSMIPLHNPDMSLAGLPPHVRKRVDPAGREYSERDIGKIPLVIGWKDWQTRLPSEAQVEKWWKEWPTANIAVVCGEVSDIFVVDADGEAPLGFMERIGVVPGLTLTAKTGRPSGYQFYFRWPGFDVSNNLGQIFAGLDIKGDGGYVVVPPSRHRLGVDYAWVDGVDEPMPAPEELLEIIRQAAQRKSRKALLPEQDLNRLLAGPIPDGERHNSAKTLFAHWIGIGMPERAVREAAYTWGQTVCRPPADNEHLQKIVTWALEQESSKRKNPEEPKMAREGDDFIFSWPDFGLRITMKNLEEDRREVWAEVIIESEVTGRLSWGRLSLPSTSGRDQLRKKMEAIRNDINWTAVLENICFMATEAFREIGDPKVPKTSDVKVVDRDILDGVITLSEGTINIVFADMASGKSTLAEAIGIAVSSGRAFPGVVIPRRKPMNTLYIDTENMREDDFVLRRTALCKGLGIPEPDNLWWFHPMRPLMENRQRIKARLDQKNIQFIILDSLAAATGMGPEKGDAAIRMIETLQYLGRTALVIAHIPKALSSNGPSEEARTAYGSIFNTAYPRTAWDISVTERTDERLTIRILHKKINLGKMRRRTYLVFQFVGAGDIPEAILLGTSAPSQAEPASTLIGLAPAGTIGDTSWWAKELGVGEAVAKARLNDMRREGYVEPTRVGGGRGRQTEWVRTDKLWHETVHGVIPLDDEEPVL